MARSFQEHVVDALMAQLALTAASPVESRGDAAGIQVLLGRFEAGFNLRDTPRARAKALITLTAFASSGERAKSRAAVEAEWAQLFATRLKSASLELNLRRLRFLQPAAALFVAEHQMSNLLSSDGRLHHVRSWSLAAAAKLGRRWFLLDPRQFFVHEHKVRNGKSLGLMTALMGEQFDRFAANQ